jgi:putative oxidoreductase
MLKSSNLYMPSTHNLLLLAGRMLLAWIFLHEGIDLMTGFNAAAAGMAKLGVPIPALVATIALQIAAGLTIALGCYARVGAAALGLFCLATAILFHNNFAVRDELLHFEKDMAIAGGMFILFVHGSGRWSIDKIWQRK